MSARSTAWLSLFASLGTLVCCALPLALVTLGLGASVAALSANVPGLIALSEHKEWLFLASGAMLLATPAPAGLPDAPSARARPAAIARNCLRFIRCSPA